MPESQLFVIDAHALCYRSYYAIKSLSTRQGQATNAVYGFIATLKKILRDYQPEYLAVCFDSPAKTRRQQKFAEYKIHRPAMPDDLVSQIPIIKEVVRAYNLPIFEKDGFEADDLIATIAKKISSKNMTIVIVSDDKDMFQLVNKKVKVLSVRKDKMFEEADVKECFGVEPQYVTDYISLAGDKADNIPGVSGIGEVSAKSLINQYGRIEDILAHIDQLKSERLSASLREQKEIALFSKELAELESNAPIQFKLDDMRVNEPDKKKLFKLFSDLEFRRYAEELSKDVQKQGTLSVKQIKTASEGKALAAQMIKKGKFAFLLDCPQERDEFFVSAHMVISLGESEVFCVKTDQLNLLKDVFAKTEVIKITHDMKENLKTLREMKCEMRGKVFDCLLAGYLLIPTRQGNDTGALAWQYLKTSIPETDKLLHETKALYQLYAPLLEEVKERGLLELLDEMETPLAHVLASMEEEGVKLDVVLLKKLSRESSKKIEGLMKELFKLAGEEFNLNSPKQLSHILFEKLNLPVIKKTKTGFSTNEEVLTRLAEQHPLPALILEYRQLAKLKSTYIDALPKLIDPHSGRVHASFNQTGTETGRLSSNNPNLQNIPIRTDLGREIRKAFIPSKKGHMIISADYSQIELRVLAHLSKDKNLIKAFQNDQDIHIFTAALIFDVEQDAVTPQMRNSAKRVNFGIIYGMSAFGLAKDLDIPQPQAQDFIDRYFLRYPGVKRFMEDEIKKCERKGYVVTLLNRRRDIPEINSSNMAVRQFAQRQAINSPVQGSAADLMKLAMIYIQRAMEKKKVASRMIITVHDELVFDVPKEEQDVMVKLIRDQMEHALSLSVPVKVTIKGGKNWLETEDIGQR